MSLVHVAFNYIPNTTEVLAFTCIFFYRAGFSFLWRLREMYDTQRRGDVATFVLLKNPFLRVTPNISRTVSLGWSNTLRPAEYKSRGQCSRMPERSFSGKSLRCSCEEVRILRREAELGGCHRKRWPGCCPEDVQTSPPLAKVQGECSRCVD